MDFEIKKASDFIIKGFGATKKVSKYPFDKLGVGDCFEIETKSGAVNVRGAISNFCKQHKKIKLSVRKTVDEKYICIRIK